MQENKVYRISNVAHAFDENTADVSSTNCIIATTEIVLPGEITQAVTSISIDQRDANQVLVTLGNYGNDTYVFFSEDGLADAPTFEDIQGNLPKMPVYASILELNSDEAIIGTEMGIWATDDASSGDWTSINGPHCL